MRQSEATNHTKMTATCLCCTRRNYSKLSISHSRCLKSFWVYWHPTLRTRTRSGFGLRVCRQRPTPSRALIQLCDIFFISLDTLTQSIIVHVYRSAYIHTHIRICIHKHRCTCHIYIFIYQILVQVYIQTQQ